MGRTVPSDDESVEVRSCLGRRLRLERRDACEGRICRKCACEATETGRVAAPRRPSVVFARVGAHSACGGGDDGAAVEVFDNASWARTVRSELTILSVLLFSYQRYYRLHIKNASLMLLILLRGTRCQYNLALIVASTVTVQ